jgi:hypothetical protein
MKRQILEALNKDGGWMSGLELVSSDPEIKRGVVYVHLMKLEDCGFVLRRPRVEKLPPEFAGLKRYEYQITSRGRAALLRDDL